MFSFPGRWGDFRGTCVVVLFCCFLSCAYVCLSFSIAFVLLLLCRVYDRVSSSGWCFVPPPPSFGILFSIILIVGAGRFFSVMVITMSNAGVILFCVRSLPAARSVSPKFRERQSQGDLFTFPVFLWDVWSYSTVEGVFTRWAGMRLCRGKGDGTPAERARGEGGICNCRHVGRVVDVCRVCFQLH